MKSFHPIALTAAAFALAVAIAAPAHAEADGPDYYRVTGVAANDTLNIRAEPSASARKIGEIPPDGNGVKNLGCQGGLSFAEWQKASPAQRKAAANSRWCRITWNGVTGWVAGRYLAEGNAPRSTASNSNAIPEQPILRQLSQDETLQRISVPANGSIKVQGIIRGYKHNVYAVTIGAGETLTVTFETQSTSAYFNLIDAADASGAAIHRGDVAGKVAKVTAVAPKTYLVQPYIVRAAARRDSTARYAFTIARQSRASSIGTPAATTVANASVRPSFDCAKAGNAATKLICTNPLLAALDVETTRLYGLAIEGKYMTPDRRRELVATERGWIKGRDECWKADNLRTCILASYASRIHELRQGYSDARTQDDKGNSTGPFVLACRNFNALIGVTFVRTDPPVAQLSWLNTAATLVLAPSGSGARYDRVTGPASMLWTRGSTARVKIDGQPELECKVETPG